MADRYKGKQREVASPNGMGEEQSPGQRRHLRGDHSTPTLPESGTAATTASPTATASGSRQCPVLHPIAPLAGQQKLSTARRAQLGSPVSRKPISSTADTHSPRTKVKSAQDPSRPSPKRPPASFRSRLASNPNPPPPAKPVPCPECKEPTSWLLCQDCIRAMMDKHREKMARLTGELQKAREKTEALLGSERAEIVLPGEMPDPFGPPSDLPRNPHARASHQGRAIVSRWTAISSDITARRADLMRSSDKVAALNQKINTRRAALLQRRQNLEQAWDFIGHEAEEHQPGGQRRRLEVDIQQLRRKALRMDEEVAKTRRKRQMQLISIFCVAPPLRGIMAKEWTMPGGFARPLPQANIVVPTSQDWTILPLGNQVALPLPTASEISRFPRQDINAAVATACQLLELMATACGTALPFTVSKDREGKWGVRPDSLWTGGAASSGAKPIVLYLGKSAYASMSQTPAPAVAAASKAATSLEASVYSLGASTLGTIESFVGLPNRNHRAWARASVLQGHEDPTTSSSTSSKASAPTRIGKTSSDTGSDDLTAVSTDHGGGQEKKEDAAVAFCRALTMLSFDAAYLAWTQGIPMDLVKAGGSILKLLFDTALASSNRRSHLALTPAANALQDFSFPVLDFSKLLQLHEVPQQGGGPGNAIAAVAKEPASSKASQPASNVSAGVNNTPKAPHQPIEESYIDAGQAVASILNLDLEADDKSPKKSIPPPPTVSSQSPRTVTQRKSPTASPSATSSDRASSRTSKTSTPAPPSRVSNVRPAVTPSSLDFLRRRGQGQKVPTSGSSHAVVAAATAQGEHGQGQGQRERSDSHSSTADTSFKDTAPAKLPPPFDELPIEKAADVSKTISTPTPTPSASQSKKSRPTPTRTPTAGAVIFNGREILDDDDAADADGDTLDAESKHGLSEGGHSISPSARRTRRGKRGDVLEAQQSAAKMDTGTDTGIAGVGRLLRVRLGLAGGGGGGSVVGAVKEADGKRNLGADDWDVV